MNAVEMTKFARLIAKEVVALVDAPLQPAEDRRWLRLKEAAKYSAIGEKRLIKLADEKKIRGFQDMESGRCEWIFDRYSIDEYRQRQMSDIEIDKKAIDILKSMGAI